MTLRFTENIYDNTVNDLVEALNNYEQVDLFFSTSGGEVAAMFSLVHYLNSRKDGLRVFLDQVCHSAGAIIFTNYTGVITITPTFEHTFLHRWDSLTYKYRKDDPYYSPQKIEKQWGKLWGKHVAVWEDAGVSKIAAKNLHKNTPHCLYRKDFKKLNLPAKILFS